MADSRGESSGGRLGQRSQTDWKDEPRRAVADFTRLALAKVLTRYGIDPEQRIANDGALADALTIAAMDVTG